MLDHYLKIAWRNLLKHKGISAINLVGFALGLTFTFVIGSYIYGEYQVNSCLRNIDRQYIIQSQWKEADMGPELTTLAPLAETMKREHPQLIEQYYRWDGISATVSYGDKHFREEVQIGDTSFLDMFGFKLREGLVTSAFSEPFSVVLTAEAATRYFGNGRALGQILTFSNFAHERKDFKVTAVMQPMPYNSVTGLSGEGQAQIYLSPDAISFFGRAPLNDWSNTVIPSYITLKAGVSPQQVRQAASMLIARHAHPDISANLRVQILPLNTYYLDSGGSAVRNLLQTLLAISLFILAMVVFNFINISISSSTRRIREIGIRKVLGGYRKQLLIQFLSESVVLVIISSVLALLVYQFTRTAFSGLFGKNLYSLHQFPLVVYGILAFAAICVGLIAGLFPALALSSYKTIDSLKGRLNSVAKHIWLRKILVGFQFSVATCALASVYVVSQQVALFFGEGLGYRKDLMVSVATPRDWTTEGVAKLKVARDELRKLPQVSDASISYAIPDGKTGGSIQLSVTGKAEPVLMAAIEADGRYADTYGLTLAAGRFLLDTKDSAGVVINESAARAYGWSDPAVAIGKELRTSPGESYVVRGVLNDFHFTSMKETIRPLCFVSLGVAPRFRYLSFRLQEGRIEESTKALAAKWHELFPGEPFELRFMDDALAQLYRSELRLRKAAYAAAGLAIVVVLLGMIGLISISIRKRAKEISVRKVLGSTPISIGKLFVSEFLITGLVAALLACPPAYYLIQRWLYNYSMRVELTVWPFLLAISILMLLVVSLVFLQTYKVSISNPVKHLRTE